MLMKPYNKYFYVPCLLAVLCAGLASCASQGGGWKGSPLWVTDREAAYPGGDWLCAVETGADKHAAEEAALASLARAFRVDVASTANASQAYVRAVQQNGGQDLTASAEFKSFARETTVSSSVSGLIGVEVDYWVSPSGEVWAIARMNRAECASRYAGLITENERLIALLAERARKVPGTFAACANLAFAQSVGELTDNYYAVFSVLKPDMTGRPLSYGGAATIKASVNDAFRAVTVQARVAGDAEGRAAQAFSRTLTARGFRMGAGGYTLKAELTLEDANEQDKNFVYIRLGLKASLVDASGGEVFTWAENERQGHQNKDGARQRALRKAEELITETGFAPAFDAWLASLL
jgi:hypothetical protein